MTQLTKEHLDKALDKHFKKVDQRFEKIDSKFATQTRQLMAYTDEQTEDLKVYVDDRTESVLRETQGIYRPANRHTSPSRPRGFRRTPAKA